MFVNVVGIEEERKVILCDYCTDVAKRSYKHKKNDHINNASTNRKMSNIT